MREKSGGGRLDSYRRVRLNLMLLIETLLNNQIILHLILNNTFPSIIVAKYFIFPFPLFFEGEDAASLWRHLAAHTITNLRRGRCTGLMNVLIKCRDRSDYIEGIRLIPIFL